MKVIDLNSPINIQKTYKSSCNFKNEKEEYKVKNSIENIDKVVLQKDSLLKNDKVNYTDAAKKEPRFANFDWEKASQEGETEKKSKINWQDAIDGKIDQKTLKEVMGEEAYRQYLKTLDRTSEGLITSKKFDKFI